MTDETQIPQLDRVAAVLDGLSDATLLELYRTLLPFDNDMIAAAVARRALTGGGGSQPGGQGIYGDGHDGAVHYTENTDLSKSVYATDITVDEGVIVNLSDWALYARGTLTNNGTIHNDGVNASSSTGGNPPNPGYGYVIESLAGGTGGSAGAAGSPGQSWYSDEALLGGGVGGAAGNLTGGDIIGGDPGLVLAHSTLRGGGLASHATYGGDSPSGDSAWYIVHTPYAGLCSGSGGAGVGGDGGGGGAGGGVDLLVCRHIVNNGVIRSVGGDGFDGAVGTVDAWQPTTGYSLGNVVQPIAPNGHVYQAQNEGTSDDSEPDWPTDGSTVMDNDISWIDLGLQGAGGGGGGQGGLVVLIYDTLTGTDPDVSGGAGGAGDGGGSIGDDGTDGLVLSICNLAS